MDDSLSRELFLKAEHGTYRVLGSVVITFEDYHLTGL